MMEKLQTIYHFKKNRLKLVTDMHYELKKIDRIRLSEYPDFRLKKINVILTELDDGYKIVVPNWLLDDSPSNNYADHAFKVKLYLQQLDDEYHKREITTVRDV